MAFNHNKLTEITFALETTNQFECQVQSWELSNDSDDPEKIYSFCPDGEDYEDVDAAWSLNVTFYSDWRADGISDYLMLNDGQNVSFELVHHPNDAVQAVKWSGTLRIKAPNVGGEVRETETQEATFQIIGSPAYARVTTTP